MNYNEATSGHKVGTTLNVYWWKNDLIRDEKRSVLLIIDSKIAGWIFSARHLVKSQHADPNVRGRSSLELIPIVRPFKMGTLLCILSFCAKVEVCMLRFAILLIRLQDVYSSGWIRYEAFYPSFFQNMRLTHRVNAIKKNIWILALVH